jgi:hypothetical protein
MGRVLFFVVLALFVCLFFQRWQRGKYKKNHIKTDQSHQDCRKLEQDVLPCLHCGVYCPLSSGVMLQGRFYCGLEHAKSAGEQID